MRAVLPVLLIASCSAAAQPSVPLCMSAREGMLHCFVETACRCVRDGGGTLTARPAGYRWDCGALRPPCAPAPADAAAPTDELSPVMPPRMQRRR